MKLQDKKGFTLIELLAVIVILAILMVLAVTGMTTVMNNARKDTFVTNALQYLNTVRTNMLSGEYDSTIGGSTLGTGECLVVYLGGIELDSGSTNSPFGYKYADANNYVLIQGDNGGSYKYYIQMIDGNDNGFTLVPQTTLSDTGAARDLVQMGNATIVAASDTDAADTGRTVAWHEYDCDGPEDNVPFRSVGSATFGNE